MKKKNQSSTNLVMFALGNGVLTDAVVKLGVPKLVPRLVL